MKFVGFMPEKELKRSPDTALSMSGELLLYLSSRTAARAVRRPVRCRLVVDENRQAAQKEIRARFGQRVG